ncbi:unnamed protein product, partial [Mycena citricolor]
CHELEMNGADDRENLELEAEVKGKLLAVIDMCRECGARGSSVGAPTDSHRAGQLGEARSELHLASARVKSLHYQHMNNMQAFCQEQFAAQAMQNAQLIQAVKNSRSKKVT